MHGAERQHQDGDDRHDEPVAEQRQSSSAA